MDEQFFEPLYEYKRIKYKGARHYLIKLTPEGNWTHHRWDGPAIVPINKESEFKKEYFLYGIPHNKMDYDEILREREGLPFYKQTNMNVRN
jgi:hypothetical protein